MCLGKSPMFGKRNENMTTYLLQEYGSCNEVCFHYSEAVLHFSAEAVIRNMIGVSPDFFNFVFLIKKIALFCSLREKKNP